MRNYEISVAWKEGERSEAHAGGKTPIEIATALESDIRPNFWTPEDLLAGAVASSMLNSTLFFAEDADIKIRSYMSNATAIMEAAVNRLTLARIVVEISITVASDREESVMRMVVDQAEQTCPVSNSLQCPVDVVLHIIVEP